MKPMQHLLEHYNYFSTLFLVHYILKIPLSNLFNETNAPLTLY